MKLKTIIAALGLTLLMASCNSSKNALPYFTDLKGQTSGQLPVMDYLPPIEPEDELLIMVTSPNPEATAVYNIPFSNPALRSTVVSPTTPRQQVYVVNSKGDINFPVLGEIHVAGKNVEQVAEDLTARIRRDVADANVSVILSNFTVNVAGEVAKPSKINVYSNRYTILDALAEAGDLTPYGERTNVLVIREENGERKFGRIDLTSSEALSSPYYYLRQNDYIYVEPNKVRQSNAAYDTNNAYKLQVTSTVVSAASVIASLIIALTVK
ncbi:MAG: polysaccharide biosynthesis/export family protein [Duncaniella sp.]|nr:polysaccharide biosynthesis/export family protein [Duncaniella sp.]